MAQIKYKSNAHADVTPLKTAASAIKASAKDITLGANTTLPAAKEFAREEMLINERLRQLAKMVILDANDALASFAEVKQTDQECAQMLKDFKERTIAG